MKPYSILLIGAQIDRHRTETVLIAIKRLHVWLGLLAVEKLSAHNVDPDPFAFFVIHIVLRN